MYKLGNIVHGFAFIFLFHIMSTPSEVVGVYVIYSRSLFEKERSLFKKESPNWWYVGMTNCFERRLEEHNDAGNRKGPFETAAANDWCFVAHLAPIYHTEGQMYKNRLRKHVVKGR